MKAGQYTWALAVLVVIALLLAGMYLELQQITALLGARGIFS
jgi:hypothetical protein